MPQIRLVPSTNAVSNASYVSVSDASNMYSNTDSTTYGTITHTIASTSYTYYVYIRGFNFDDVPSNATVNSFTVKIKASATGHTTNTSSNYYMSLINGTTQINSTNASGRLSTTTTTFTFANGSLTWSQVVGYGANFGIRIPLRRANSNTADVVSVYGAEILVDYTIPVTAYTVSVSSTDQTLTASVNDEGTSQDITAGQPAVIYIDGSDFTGLHATDNGVDVTSSLVYVPEDTDYPAYYTYNIAAVNEAHVIVVSQVSVSTYTISASTSASGLTLTLSSGGNSSNPLTVNEGSTVILTISGSDLTNLSITDNGIDATSSLVSNNGVTTYTISNVQAAHTLVVSQTITPSTYTVRLVASECTVSDSSKVTVTNENYLYENTDNTSGYATVQGPNNYTEYYFFLHGFNFSDVPENAIVSSFTVKIKGYRNNNNVSSSNYLRTAPSNSSSSDYISISSSNVISFNLGTSQQTLTLPTYDTTWRQLANCDDFSIQLGVRSNSASSAACVYIYGAEIEVTYTLPFTISASSEVARATIQPESLVVRPGKSAKFILNTNRGIVLKDNGVDVTSQIAQELDPGYSYSVTNLTDPWGFFLNDDDYYESNTQNERNSSACCRFDFHLAATGNISFSVINYAEDTHDYGIFYKLDITASTAYNTDVSGSKVYWTGNGNNSASVQTVTYTGVSAGDHYIYIKYKKDSSGNQYNDSLQFKVASVTITGSYTPGNIYTYSINPVQANHTIVVEQGIMVYDISATTSSSGLTLAITDTTTSATGNPLTITEGHTARLSISGNDLTDIIITDNGTDVTSSLATVSGEKQYTITNVQADHTLVIYQSFGISTSMNGNYLGISTRIEQGGTQVSDYRDVDAGTSCYAQLIHYSDNNTTLPQTGITATDNGTNVTSSLVYNTSSYYDFYRYTLTNVQTDHNVVFGYTGTYYTISASTSTNSGLTMYLGDESGTNISGKCFPGGYFDLYIEGQDSNLSLVHVTDNGVDVTSSLVYMAEYTYGNYTQPAYYTYAVTDVQANHTIVVSLQKIYLKINGSYVQMANVYKKISNEWVKQTDYTTLFDNNHIYIHK